MNIRPRFLPLPLIALVPLVGCDTSPDPLAPTPPPATVRAEAPGNGGGAVVTRFQNTEFILVFDEKRELLAAHMPSTVCREPGLNPVDVMRVEKPSQVATVFAKVTSDDAVVSIYHATSPSDAGLEATIHSYGFPNVVDFDAFCAFLEGPDRIAEGTVRRITTFTGASFHGRWTGTLQGTDGRDYRLTEVYQLNADAHDPFNPDTFFEPVVAIHLRPTR